MGRPITIPAILLAAASLLPGQTVGEPVLDPVNGRTLEDLTALALRQNGDVLAAEQTAAAAEGELTQAKLRRNPELEVSGMQEFGGPMNTFMVGGSIPLELFGRRDRRSRVAGHGVAVSRFERAEVERRVSAQLSAKFGEVLAAAELLRFTDELLATNREELRLTEIRAERGAVPALDGSLMRVEVNRLEASRIEFESRLGVAVLELKNLAGMRPEEPLRIKGTLDVPPPAMSKDEAITRALDSRPDLRSLREVEARANARIREAETEGKLDVSVTASYQRLDSGFPFQGLTPEGQLARIQAIFHVGTLGAKIMLPVRNRNQGAIASASAELVGARRRREYAELAVSSEISAASLQVAKTRESLDIYQKTVREQARQNLSVVRRAYELGRGQLLGVIAEQRRLIEIETGYIEAMGNYYQALSRLRFAAGL
jgi:cobalt-zinc-cadmium efflux system outer membrane protein